MIRISLRAHRIYKGWIKCLYVIPRSNSTSARGLQTCLLVVSTCDGSLHDPVVNLVPELRHPIESWLVYVVVSLIGSQADV